MDSMVNSYLKLQQQFAPQLAGANLEWLQQLQQQAKIQLQQQGFPNKKIEAWKHWPHQAFKRLSLKNFITSTSTTAPKHLSLANNHYLLNFIDGLFYPQNSQLDLLTKQVQVTRFEDYLTQQPNKAQSLLQNIGTQDGFGALTTLFVKAGLVIHIPDEIKLERPIMLHHSNTSQHNLSCPIYAIHLGSRSSASIIHIFESEHTNSFMNHVTHIYCEQESTLHHYQIQNEGHQATHINRTHAYMQAQSQFHSFHAQLGAKLSRHEIHAHLQGEKAQCKLNGFLIAGEQQHCDHFTQVMHEHPKTFSHQNYKAMISQHGYGVFNGKIIVQPNVHGCEAHQVNHNLLLADKAKMVSRPQLEIFNDDVICTHGATSGFIDPDKVFYLLSRGITHSVALALLSYGFAKSQIALVTNENLRTYLLQALMQAIPNSDQLQELIQ